MNPDAERTGNARIHRRTEIFRGRHFSFVTENLTLPNGRRTDMAMVCHPGSVGIVPLLDDRNVVMEHQYRPCVRGKPVIRPPSSSTSAGPISCRPTPTRSSICSSPAD
ncbi:MAG: hypothetical protein MUC57_16610 [Desulfobacterales bacterium]|nr:hypothetical protein [Desulfobacterales bacterium]